MFRQHFLFAVFRGCLNLFQRVHPKDDSANFRYRYDKNLLQRTQARCLTERRMADSDSAVGSPTNEKPVDDGQEQDYQDAVAAADSDRESDILSEVDENQFEDYDPETANIENRPVDIDEDIAATLKVSKRKRIEGDAAKKPREGRREKKRRDQDEDTGADDLSEVETTKKPRRSRRAADGERRPRAKAAEPEPEDDESLTPEERRKRAIDKALDSALKKNSGSKRRRKDEEVCGPFFSTSFVVIAHTATGSRGRIRRTNGTTQGTNGQCVSSRQRRPRSRPTRSS